jgi:hypothetical protein
MTGWLVTASATLSSALGRVAKLPADARVRSDDDGAGTLHDVAGHAAVDPQASADHVDRAGDLRAVTPHTRDARLGLGRCPACGAPIERGGTMSG